jgi:thiosulfate/3-mercaptopyruvate sulfurtransferase
VPEGAAPRERIARTNWHTPAVSLVSANDLAARIDDPDLRIVDVRWYLGQPGQGRAAYDHGHVPGAIFLDLDGDLSAPTGPGRHPLPDPAVFALRLGAAGIGDGDFVVAYDDVGGWVAARLWWMLDDLGHDRAAVLDGGIPAWIAAGHPLTTEIPDPVGAHLDLAGQWTKVVDRDELRARLGRVLLLDARAPARYRGETEPVDAYPGHIPTARNAPTTDSLGPDGRFLPPAQLAARFRALGADQGPVVVSCGSGVSACHDSLAMRIAGLPDPILYPGSYSDWTRAGEPVAVGSDPGEPPRD